LQTGALAGERALNKEVRAYGRMLARDHRAVRQQGRDLVKKLGVTPTPPADSTNALEHAKALRELGALRGRAFDKAFLAHEVEYHAQVLDAVNDKVLPAISNAELKALVERVAPAFEAHMQAAKALQKKLKLE
jgi:putative membrane protein